MYVCKSVQSNESTYAVRVEVRFSLSAPSAVSVTVTIYRAKQINWQKDFGAYGIHNLFNGFLSKTVVNTSKVVTHVSTSNIYTTRSITYKKAGIFDI